MNSKKRILLLTFLFVLVLLLTLACNLPTTISSFIAGNQNSSQETIVAMYDATLVNSEGEAVFFPLAPGMEWICKDIKGELSVIQGTEEIEQGGIQIFKLNKAILEWKFIYHGTNEVLYVSYLKDFDRDYAVVDKDNNVVSWENDKWSGDTSSVGLNLTKNKIFLGTIDVKVTQVDTHPIPFTGERLETHNFFGLISRANIQKAFLCDHLVNPLPGKTEHITADNFQENCHFYYYECSAK